MYKTQSYDIHASFLVPAYNLPEGVLSHYITTIEGHHERGSIATDVWLVKALKENTTQSMIASLRKERINYQNAMEEELVEGKTEKNNKKVLKIQELENGKDLFAQLVARAQDSKYHKKPDDEFLKVVHDNFARAGFSSCQPDLKHYLYLAGSARYEER